MGQDEWLPGIERNIFVVSRDIEYNLAASSCLRLT